MRTLTSRLERKKAALCILTAICAISLFVIFNSGEKIKNNTGGSYVIRIKHYGIDAAEMERSVTIPLEDSLFSIPGIVSIQSSSENSLSSVFIRFRSGTRGHYEAIRDAAQRVYETLPSSAQRPEILSSNNSRIPVWSASVTADDLTEAARLLEKTLKPKLESLEGAGEVIVSGIGTKEIYIILDQEKLSVLGLEPYAVSSALGLNDSIFSGGTITLADKEIIVTVDSRLSRLEKALIPIKDGKYVELSDIALVMEREREPDIYSRLNGKKTAGIAVMSRHGADLRKLSSDIKKVISASYLPLEFIVLSDLGAEENAAYKSVLNAALTAALMIAFISYLLNRKNKISMAGIFCALSIPLICLFSIAVMSICGFSIDRLLLAGIAAGVGTAIDAVILCSERLRKCVCFKSASASLSSLTAPLLAGSATTIAALVPLSSMEETSVRIIASAIAVVTLVSLVLSLTLLPPLLLWDLNKDNKKTFTGTKKTPQFLQFAVRRLFRKTYRLLAAVIKFCANYPVLIIASSIVITVIAVLIIFSKGADVGSLGSEDSVFAQVEFEGGLLADEVDRLLAAYSEQLLDINGIINVETGARTGSGSLLISFDPTQTKTHIIRNLAKQIYIPGGFIFFHENSITDRYWEIFIYGDEDQKCRDIAKELAYLCASHPLIRERVLNFKQGSKKMIFIPDREILAESKISFSEAASRARLGVYGPVSYKRMIDNEEIDVRIKTGRNDLRQSREGSLGLLVSSLRLDSFAQIKDDIEPSSIRRDNRRRYASITISTKPMDPKRVKNNLLDLFKKLEMPQGYSIEFDPEAIKQSESLKDAVLSFALAVIFCYMIIACINESFCVPLLILSTITPSLAIPAIFLVLTGSSYNLAVACAFIAVSGMTVNAAILCVDGIKSRAKLNNEKSILTVYLAIREKLPALLSTTGTTAAGAIPFLFLSENANSLIRTISLVSALGVAGSCICSITIIPSLLFLFKSVPLVRDKKTILE